MNKKEFLEALTENTGLSEPETKQFSESLTALIADMLNQGKTILLPNFGSLSVQKSDGEVDFRLSDVLIKKIRSIEG
ncbi:MAG: HU family DNA-binding protein [Dysgonamonadaceae bacterium]|jgi:nucleoid DNA-binding protein|nr:HU family DNA-binding protein [Dysgonamonadaceae bacterium]